MSDPIPVTKNRMLPGGDAWEVEGELTIKSGGTITFEEGSIISGLDPDEVGINFATNEQALAGESAILAISPATLKTVVDDRVVLATNEEAIAGTDDEKLITPATMKAAIDDRLLADGTPAAATITVGAEGSDTINAAIQLKDIDSADLTNRAAVKAYLSADQYGDSIITSAPTGGVAIGTDGLLIPIVADKFFELVSESDGDIDIDIEDTGTPTMYLVIILPNGKLVVSSAITFAS